MFTLSCHGWSTAVRPVALSLTVYTTTECRRSRMFPLAEQRCCTCGNGVTVATAASVSLRRTPSQVLPFHQPSGCLEHCRFSENGICFKNWRSIKTGKPKLVDWLAAVEIMDLPEFDDCTKAYHNWFQEIANSMDIPWSNGFIEGCNNKTKVLKRVCFDMRNFSNFRKRILFCHI